MADTPTTEDIAKMSVTDAKALLPSLSDDQLADLKKLETNDGEDEGRVTMLAAIDAEQARRIADAGGGGTSGTPAADQTKSGQEPDAQTTINTLHAQCAAYEADLTAIGEAIGAGAYDEVTTGVVVIGRVRDLAIARIAALHNVQEELVAVRAELADAKLHEKLGVAPVGAPVANYLHVTQLGATGFVLVLLDGEDDIDLPPIPVISTDFVQRSADVVVYDRPIALPIAMPPVRLTSVELRDDEGDGIDRCNMVPTMEAGGGRSVELPPGTLLFRQPDRSAAEAAKASAAADAMAGI